jgi:creatinine amidohydrolase
MAGACLMSRDSGSSADHTSPAWTQETKYGNLTYQEVRDRAEEGFIAIVPTGCTEQQGLHLPVDFDTWFAEQLMWTAAARARSEYGINALVLPALPFGPTPEHRNFGGGYIDIPKEVHHQMVWAILDSLVTQGFQRILVWRGCGGHDLDDLIKRFNVERGTRVYLPEQPYHAIWCRIGDATVPCGHADSFTTSICLYLRPKDVRMDKLIDPGEQSIDWNEPNLDFTRHSKTGVIGDPRHATAELGERLWNATLQEATRALLVVNQPPMEPNETKTTEG